MKPGETRNERLKRQASEKAAKKLLAMAADDVACAAPDPKRRPGHSRRPDWTVGGRKR